MSSPSPHHDLGPNRQGIGSHRSITDPPDTGIDDETLRAATDQATESIVIADATGRLLYANLAAERRAGLPRSELVGRHFLGALAGGHDGTDFLGISRTISAGMPWRGRHVATTVNGSRVAADLVVSPIRDATGRLAYALAIGRDAAIDSDLQDRLEREVRLRAGIVSTLSRIHSAESVEEQAQQLADALMDLTGVGLARVVAFGPGDAWHRLAARGHEAIAVAGPRPTSAHVRSVKRRARHGAWITTVQRWGAGEPICAGLEAAGFGLLALAPISHRGETVGLLVAASSDSVGTPSLEDHLSAIAELADVGSAMLGSTLASRKVEASVRGVVERVISEDAFKPVYQPIVRLRDGAVLGYEALTRFDDRRDPGVRFAEAAALGLGFELEIVTLRAAVRDARALPGGSMLTLNVSPALVLEGRRLDEVLHASAFDGPIVLELSEREPVQDYRGLRKAIERITRPVGWAIDDVGAGYASLRHILELRPRYVKLDRGLIADFAIDPARQALVVGLLHFSEALGTVLIAEGIETDAERLALEGLGVTAGQGYLLGRPTSIDAIVDEGVNLPQAAPVAEHRHPMGRTA